SAYRDGVRCGFTLFTAFSRASHPDRLHVGVVDQVLPDDSTCLDEYCNLATAHWGDCRYKSQIQIDTHDALTSTGPTVARHFQQQMIRDEEFCMELDAHSQVLPQWDTILVQEWARTNNEMAVLSTYPVGFDMISPNLTYPHQSSSHLCDHNKRGQMLEIPICTGIINIYNSNMPQLSAYFGGGLSFSKCHAEKRAPIDKHLKWVFWGEEALRSYSPWHRRVAQLDGGTQPHFLERHALETKAKEELLSYNHIRTVMKLPFEALPLRRSLLDFFGLSNRNASLDSEPCHQLHWVPFARAEIVEALFPGWFLHLSTRPAPISSMAENTTMDLADDALVALEAKLERNTDTQAQQDKADESHMVQMLMKRMDAQPKQKLNSQSMSIVQLVPGMLVVVAMVLIAYVAGSHRVNKYEPVSCQG
ncbi:hypothetical protein As57867_008847, partial [Aphanomyces stellatus]